MNWTEDDLINKVKNNPSLAARNEKVLGEGSVGKNWRQPQERAPAYYSDEEEMRMKEGKIQERFFKYLETNLEWQPLFDMFFSIPNGTNKSPAMRGVFNREGLKSGVPDIFFPVPRRGYHGMFIEMKRRKNSKTSAEQEMWITRLKRQGYYVVKLQSLRALIVAIKFYLDIPDEE
jgi:hypothetical protein